MSKERAARLDDLIWPTGANGKTTSDGGSHPEQEQGPSSAFYSCWLSICVRVCVCLPPSLSVTIVLSGWLAGSLACSLARTVT